MIGKGARRGWGRWDSRGSETKVGLKKGRGMCREDGERWRGRRLGRSFEFLAMLCRLLVLRMEWDWA
jgi:hypothetical protein